VTTIGLTTIALAGTDSDQWGEWDQLTLTQDNVAHNLELDKSEIHQGTINFAEAASSFHAAGTELAGGQPSGLDTNMALDVNGIPVDFHGEEVTMTLPSDYLPTQEDLDNLTIISGSGVFDGEGLSEDSDMSPLEQEGEAVFKTLPDSYLPSSDDASGLEAGSESGLGALDSYFVPNK